MNFFEKKSNNVEKKLKDIKGGPFSLARCCMLRRKKPLVILFARPNGSIGHHKILKNFCRTILVTSCGLNKSEIFSTPNISNMNLQMSFKNKPTGHRVQLLLLIVHTILTPEITRNNFLWKVNSKTSDCAWSIMNIKYSTDTVEIYVFKKRF